VQSTYLYWLIVGCEVAFWVLLALALAARYLWQRMRLSQILLLALPIVDLALLGFTALDLASGAPATFAHGLAAAYVGFTVAFGGIAVAWADQHFAYWFAGGPVPPGIPTRGWPALRYDLLLWARCLAAVAITLVLVAALIAIVNDEAATASLRLWLRIPIGCAFFWFVAGPLWTLLFSSWRREPGAVQ